MSQYILCNATMFHLRSRSHARLIDRGAFNGGVRFSGRAPVFDVGGVLRIAVGEGPDAATSGRAGISAPAGVRRVKAARIAIGKGIRTPRL